MLHLPTMLSALTRGSVRGSERAAQRTISERGTVMQIERGAPGIATTIKGAV